MHITIVFVSISFQRYQRDTTSDSDSDNDGEFWHHQSKPAPAKSRPVDSTALEKSEITTLTKRSLGPGASFPGATTPNITNMLAGRSLGGSFSLKDKRLLSGHILPHNQKKVKTNDQLSTKQNKIQSALVSCVAINHVS